MWNVLSVSTNSNLSNFSTFFFEVHYWDIECTRQMTYQKYNIILGKIVFHDNNQARISWACLGQTCSRSLIVFLSQLFVNLLIIFGCFWRIHLSKTCDEATVWVTILCSAAGYILLSPRLCTSQFRQKIASLNQWQFPPRRETQTFLQLAQKRNLSAKIWQNLLFASTLSDTLWYYAKRDWTFIDGSKYLLIFDDSCKPICKSIAFVDNATASRHRGSSTIFIKHSLFQQSKFGRYVELQNSHIVLFRSHRDVMQVSTISAQLGLGSDLVEWYRHATFVPYGYLLIELSPRTDDRLRYCTNTGSFPQNFISQTGWNTQKFLGDEHTKSLYSPSVSLIFPQRQKSFPSVLPKRVYPVSLRLHNKSAQRKTAKHKETSPGKISKRSLSVVSTT